MQQSTHNIYNVQTIHNMEVIFVCSLSIFHHSIKETLLGELFTGVGSLDGRTLDVAHSNSFGKCRPLP